jgi:hypothetical protein
VKSRSGNCSNFDANSLDEALLDVDAEPKVFSTPKAANDEKSLNLILSAGSTELEVRACSIDGPKT